MRALRQTLPIFLIASAPILFAQAPRVWTAAELFTRNVGTTEQQNKQFPPHKIIGNIYYVGTETLGSFLVTTPQGHILINTDYERNNAVIRDSVVKLGFRFEDIKIILGSHAHGDHMEGDALIKQQTGAQVMAMAEDVPGLQAMRPGGKDHPIDRVLHDGDQVKLGDMTLTALLTPGHTSGCTTWTMKVQDGGRAYDVLVIGSMGVNSTTNLVGDAARVAQYRQGFKVLHAQHVDVPLGSHPAMYNMVEKHAKLASGGANPYIDPRGFQDELTIQETAFNIELKRQETDGPPARGGGARGTAGRAGGRGQQD
jgi:metallo-beta-lactamase class B